MRPLKILHPMPSRALHLSAFFWHGEWVTFAGSRVFLCADAWFCIAMQQEALLLRLMHRLRKGTIIHQGESSTALKVWETALWKLLQLLLLRAFFPSMPDVGMT